MECLKNNVQKGTEQYTLYYSTCKLSAMLLNSIIPSSISSTVCIKCLFSQLFYETTPKRSPPSNTHSHNFALHINVLFWKLILLHIFLLCFMTLSIFVALSDFLHIPHQVLLSLPLKCFLNLTISQPSSKPPSCLYWTTGLPARTLPAYTVDKVNLVFKKCFLMECI